MSARRRLLLGSSEVEDVRIEVKDTLVGDVVFYNPKEDGLVIRREREYWRRKEVPVGVVVIPGSHNIYGNGGCGVMALMAASTFSPDMGSTSYQLIYWGQYDNDISELKNYRGMTVYGNYDQWSAAKYRGGYAYLPSDLSYFRHKNQLTESDQNCGYYYNDDNYHAPSPYLNDGSRNPDYYNTTNILNVLSDFKGKENTTILIAKAIAQSDWKTSPSITNEPGLGYSPAACCCWRYHTEGTKQGDWYLPAIGELGYVCVRYKKINDTISALRSYFGKIFCMLTDYPFWSSSEYSSDHSWYVSFYSGQVYPAYKNTDVRTPLFMQLKPKFKTETKFIDMGLSVDWAWCNMGANSPEEGGWYFVWAGTTPYNSDRTPVGGGPSISFWYSNCPYWVNDSGVGVYSKWLKYTAQDKYSLTGTKDDKWTLEPEDDAVNANMGGDCRMPTQTEYRELSNACNKAWIENYNGTGVNGMMFTLKSDPSKTLFFPAAGAIDSNSFNYEGVQGFYWTSSLNGESDKANCTMLYSSTYTAGSRDRYMGMPVRAVKPKK